MWGISYPGFYVAAGMIDAHPALKAASPQAPIVDWFAGDDWHHNGALFLPHAFNFFANFGHPRPEPTKKGSADRFEYGTPDGYAFFLDMGRCPMRTRNTSRTTFRSGTRCSSIPTTMTSGPRGTCGLTSGTSSRP